MAPNALFDQGKLVTGLVGCFLETSQAEVVVVAVTAMEPWSSERLNLAAVTPDGFLDVFCPEFRERASLNDRWCRGNNFVSLFQGDSWAPTGIGFGLLVPDTPHIDETPLLKFPVVKVAATITCRQFYTKRIDLVLQERLHHTIKIEVVH